MSRLEEIFQRQKEQAVALTFPNITLGGKLRVPTLMQKNFVRELIERKHIGNFSEMGTGKTLSAILGAWKTKAKLTLIICPNDVKETWEEHIKAVFPEVNIAYDIRSKLPVSRHPTFVVSHYEQFQQSWSKQEIEKFVKRKVDYLIFDEIFKAKQ